jgi:hypothetical protein
MEGVRVRLPYIRNEILYNRMHHVVVTDTWTPYMSVTGSD